VPLGYLHVGGNDTIENYGALETHTVVLNGVFTNQSTGTFIHSGSYFDLYDVDAVFENFGKALFIFSEGTMASKGTIINHGEMLFEGRDTHCSYTGNQPGELINYGKLVIGSSVKCGRNFVNGTYVEAGDSPVPYTQVSGITVVNGLFVVDAYDSFKGGVLSGKGVLKVGNQYDAFLPGSTVITPGSTVTSSSSGIFEDVSLEKLTIDADLYFISDYGRSVINIQVLGEGHDQLVVLGDVNFYGDDVPLEINIFFRGGLPVSGDRFEIIAADRVLLRNYGGLHNIKINSPGAPLLIWSAEVVGGSLFAVVY